MPYKRMRSSKGGYTVKNTRTGKKRKFRSKAAFRRWVRVAEAVKHGWRPTRK